MAWREQFGQLARTIEGVFPGERDLDALFARGRPLRVKLGLDITSPSVTIGNEIQLRNLPRFQELGHQVVLILGDFTTLVGDPSGRDKTRPMLTPEQIEANSATWTLGGPGGRACARPTSSRRPSSVPRASPSFPTRPPCARADRGGR